MRYPWVQTPLSLRALLDPGIQKMDELEQIILRDLQKFMVSDIKLRVKEMWGRNYEDPEYYALHSPSFDDWCVAAIIGDECLIGYILKENDCRIRTTTPEVFRVSLADANYRELFQQRLLNAILRRCKDQANHHAFRMQVSRVEEDTEEHSRQMSYYIETVRVIEDMLKEIALRERRAARDNS